MVKCNFCEISCGNSYCIFSNGEYVVSEKEKIKKELESLKSQNQAPDWMNWMSYAMLKEKYLDEGETPRQRYKTIAKTAASYAKQLPTKVKWETKFFNLIWDNWLAPSTPVMANMGTNKGLATSCSATYIGDSMWDISYSDYEISLLTKYGFGTSAYFNVRGSHENISTGGKTNHPKDWIEKYWRTQNTVSQGSVRRGSTAMYFDIDHKDLLTILPMMEKYEKLHLAVNVNSKFKERLKSGDQDALIRYRTVLFWRMKKGKPYITFIDNAQKQDPPQYKKIGLKTVQSNLCNEIYQHTDSDHTLACVLSSMVGNKFDEWKNTSAVFDSIVFLDCVNEDLIRKGTKIKGLERVVNSAKKSRALGLGLLGFHTYLQEHNIIFGSLESRYKNQEIFEHLKTQAIEASKFLAKHNGEPEWCKGTGLANTHLLAIAPNTSSAFMAGAVSQGIEPTIANVYTQKLAAVGSVERINPVFLKLLREKNKYNEDIINSISFNKGSVQHLDFLSLEEKSIFKTAFEVNQKTIIEMANQRQKWICQGQSLNLFFDANEDENWIHEVHKYAFEQDKLKGLYYVRTQAGIKADNDCVACEG